MIVKQDGTNYTIEFEREDWTTNLARPIMKAIKGLPYHERRYIPLLKTWEVVDNKENKRVLNEVYAEWHKVQPTDIKLDDYDVNKFLKQFGNDIVALP